MPTIKEIITPILKFAPLPLQEPYDNSGLIIGNQNNDCTGALITIDINSDVVNEALQQQCNLIIAHHPLIFNGIKQISDETDVGKSIILCIKHDISIFISHTNIDRVKNGVSWKMAQKLNLKNIQTLSPNRNYLKKLITFVPQTHAEKVREALFQAGAGSIGNYDQCSFNTEGFGTFRGNDHSEPFLGKRNETSYEKEIKIEVILNSYNQSTIVTALKSSHPYEEIAYDVIPLDNKHPELGFGVVGILSQPIPTKDFLSKIKSAFKCDIVKYSPITKKEISKVALCGGSGSSLIDEAQHSGSDIYITGDIKYHQFFEAEGKIILADIGHFESEQFTKEIFYEIVQKKFPKFALHLSVIKTNPVNYLFLK